MSKINGNKKKRHKPNNEWNKPTKPYEHNHNESISDALLNPKAKSKKINPVYNHYYKSAYMDTHCHLDWILFKSGYALNDYKSFAKNNFVGNYDGCVVVSCAEDNIKTVSKLMKESKIYAAFGLHPHNAKEWSDVFKEKLLDALLQFSPKYRKISSNNNNNNSNWECVYCGKMNKMDYVVCEDCFMDKEIKEDSNDDCNDDSNVEMDYTGINIFKDSNGKIVALGECGLDYHYTKSPRNCQKYAFIEQIKIANLFNLPLIVHTREAEKDTIEILKKYATKNMKIHLHCFSDSIKMAKELIEYFPNCFLGFTGAVTFKNAKHTRLLVKIIPLNRILLETDGPYMAPFPFRGKPAHAGYIPIIAKKIAQLKGIQNVETVLKQTRINAKSMYGV